MARTFQHKMLTLKIGLLEEQRNQLLSVMSAIDKVLSLANDWTRNADEGSDITFEELNCLVEDMVLFLGDKFADLPGDLDGFQMLNMKEMQKAVSCLNMTSKKMQQNQSDTEEYFENTQCLDNYLQTEQKSITSRKQDEELLTDKQKCTEMLNQTVIKVQADIEENSQLLQNVITEQKENNKIKKQLEEATATLDDILDNMETLGNRVGLLEIESVDNKQFSNVQMRCEILEVNSENAQCMLDDMNTQLQELGSKVEEASKNLTPIPEFKNLQKAEEKINAFEEEWSKRKEEVGKLFDDFESEKKMLCKIIADRLAPLERLRDIFNKQLDTRKDNVKKLDTVCKQVEDILPKVLLYESKCKGELAGFIVQNVTSITKPRANSVVHFDKIITNFGNHFQIESGKFTSPGEGLYAVSLNINGDKNIETSIVKKLNSTYFSLFEVQEVILGKVTTTTNNSTASVFIVVHLNAGDSLFVKYGSVGTDSSFLRDSTFAGFRISEV